MKCRAIAGLLGLTFCLLLLEMPLAEAQEPKAATFDSAYYLTYPEHLMLWPYMGLQYEKLKVDYPNVPNYPFSYSTNARAGIGAGFTYKWLGLNLDFGIVPLVSGLADSAKSKTFRLQTMAYGRKSPIDLFARYSKGFYQVREDTDPHVYLSTKPNMSIIQLGGKYEHMLNWRRFSMRAPFFKNEQQLRSAGSPLLGFEAIYLRAQDDNSMVPPFNEFIGLPDFRTVRILSVGPLAGYAYTWVPFKHVFLTAGGVAGYNLQFVKSDGSTVSENSAGFKPQFSYRLAAGYNADRWSFGIFSNNARHFASTNSIDFDFNYNFYRALIAYRFLPKGGLHRTLQVVDLIEVLTGKPEPDNIIEQ